LSLTGAGTSVTIGRAGQEVSATLAGTAGQWITLATTGSTIAGIPDVVVNGPDGAQVGTTLSFAGAGSVMTVGLLPTTGTYTVRVRPERGVTGSFTLTASARANVGGIGYLSAKTVTVARVAQEQHGTFAGTAGKVVTLKVTANTVAGFPEVFVYRPDGTQLGSSHSFSGATVSVVLGTMPVTGTYALRIRPDRAVTGSLAVQLVASAVAAAPTTRAGARPSPGVERHPASVSSAAHPASLVTSQPAWRPDRANLHGVDWLARRARPGVAAPLRGPPGVTGVSGRVLGLDGAPLPGVRVGVERRTTSTDRQGRFLLTGIPASATRWWWTAPRSAPPGPGKGCSGSGLGSGPDPPLRCRPRFGCPVWIPDTRCGWPRPRRPRRS
jgi:hypothetical protein